MFRLIIPFALGILAAIVFSQPDFVSLQLILIVTALLFAASMLSNIFSSFKLQWLGGLCFYLFLFSAGYGLTFAQNPNQNHTYFSNFKNPNHRYLINISEPPQEKTNSIRVIANVTYVEDSIEWKKATGKILLYFEKDSASAALKYGDVLFISTPLNQTEPPANPHQFNYKRYLSFSGIYYQSYLRNKNWYLIDSGAVNPVYQFSYKARSKMLEMLSDNGISGDEFAVVSAILLGYDENLEPELRDKYAGAGALHVLCVSGLHVGIVFALMEFFLVFLNRRKSWRVLRLIIILLSIWAYAFITGLSPSVQRASVMFSFLAFRQIGKYHSNPYNLLTASAFVLLLLNPYIITKIGFQLSYAAVVAIIALFNPIYSLVAIKHKFPDAIWKLLVVSFAAQVGTFPLSIYYFHQFPNYFFLTNLLVIPLVWLIIYTGIISLVISLVWKWLAAKISFLLNLMLLSLNESVSFIDALPWSKMEDLVLYLPQVLILYGLIILIVQFFLQKRGTLLVLTLIFLIALTFSFGVSQYNVNRQQKLIVYQVNNHTAIDICFDKETYYLCDSLIAMDKKAFDFNIKNNRIYCGTRQVKEFVLDDSTFTTNFDPAVIVISKNFIDAFGKRIAILDNDFNPRIPASRLKVDYLILRNNPKAKFEDIIKIFKFKYLILDSSNDWWLSKDWSYELEVDGVKVHNTRMDGAFVRNLN
jgi:competence protein ComEC